MFVGQPDLVWLQQRYLIFVNITRTPTSSAHTPHILTHLTLIFVGISPPIRKKTFYWSLFNAIKYDILLQHIYGTPALLLPLVAPYCLNKIVKYIECEDCGAPTLENYIWVFALLLATLLESIALQATCHIGRRIFVHVTSICNTAVFEKSIRRKDVSGSAPDATAKDAKEKSERNDEDSDDATKPINVSSKYLVHLDFYLPPHCGFESDHVPLLT